MGEEQKQQEPEEQVLDLDKRFIFKFKLSEQAEEEYANWARKRAQELRAAYQAIETSTRTY